MDESSRKFIKGATKELVRLTDYKKLIRACEEEGLFSNIMCARIENLSDATEEEKHTEIFHKITRRGPHAFDKLIDILNKLDYAAAVSLLHRHKTEDSTYISIHNKENKNKPPSVEAPSNQNIPDGCYPTKEKIPDSKLPLTPFTDEIVLNTPFTVKKSTTIQHNPKIPVYPMRTRNRGVLLMVNIIDFSKTDKGKRLGADIDGQNLLYLFREMGFICFQYVNLTSVEFFDIVHRLCESEYTARTESFVLILMSHGEMTEDMHDRVEFHDGSIAKLYDIENRFSNVSCANLRNKPKVLIFPFCRGPKSDKGVSTLQKDGFSYQPSNISPNIPSKSDMLVCYATVCGFQSMRDTIDGSWYVQEFCKAFAEHAHETHMEDLLKIICGEIKKLRSKGDEMQTPAYNNHGFSKCLYFNPGVYEE